MDSSKTALTQTELNSQLLIAAQRGEINSLKSLIAQGAEVKTATNFLGETAFMLASKNGRTEFVCALIPYLDEVAWNATTPRGNTAFLLAAMKGHVEMIKILLTLPNININATRSYDESTVLICAAQKGYVDIVSILIPYLDQKALNASDEEGCTALMYAAHFGHQTIAFALIDAGADVSLVNYGGFQTALEMASDADHREIAFRLLSAMKLQRIFEIHGDLTLNNLANECIKSVMTIQREIFYLLHLLPKIPRIAADPLKLIFSYSISYPDWYWHRMNSDINLMKKKLAEILTNRAAKTSVPVAVTQLTRSSLPTRSITYAPMATTLNNAPSVVAEKPSRAEKDKRKKARHS
jgi:ankyrin repeat protein